MSSSSLSLIEIIYSLKASNSTTDSLSSVSLWSVEVTFGYVILKKLLFFVGVGAGALINLGFLVDRYLFIVTEIGDV